MHKSLDNIRTRVSKLQSQAPELARKFAAVEELESQLDLLFPDETEARAVVRGALARAWYELQNVARHMGFEDTIIMNLSMQVEADYRKDEAPPDPLKLQGQASQAFLPQSTAAVSKPETAWTKEKLRNESRRRLFAAADILWPGGEVIEWTPNDYDTVLGTLAGGGKWPWDLIPEVPWNGSDENQTIEDHRKALNDLERGDPGPGAWAPSVLKYVAGDTLIQYKRRGKPKATEEKEGKPSVAMDEHRLWQMASELAKGMGLDVKVWERGRGKRFVFDLFPLGVPLDDSTHRFRVTMKWEEARGTIVDQLSFEAQEIGGQNDQGRTLGPYEPTPLNTIRKILKHIFEKARGWMMSDGWPESGRAKPAKIQPAFTEDITGDVMALLDGGRVVAKAKPKAKRKRSAAALAKETDRRAKLRRKLWDQLVKLDVKLERQRNIRERHHQAMLNARKTRQSEAASDREEKARIILYALEDKEIELKKRIADLDAGG